MLVGEWSGAAIFANSSVTPEGRNAYERVFIANQLASFAPAAGWFFQTWKTEKRIAAWDARAALEEGEPASAVAKRLSQKYSRRKRDVYAMVLDMQ